MPDFLIIATKLAGSNDPVHRAVSKKWFEYTDEMDYYRKHGDERGENAFITRQKLFALELVMRIAVDDGLEV